MNISHVELGRRLGMAPLRVLVELAAMSQPGGDRWPGCDDAFEGTLAERRRIRMGLLPRLYARPGIATLPSGEEKLAVSEPAAAILDKLLRKSYGLKPIRVFTLGIQRG